MTYLIHSNKKGFTLIEILMVVVLIGILATVSISNIGDANDENRFDATLEEMKEIEKAIMGEKSIKENGLRTSFGYFGDIGALPANLSNLVTNPGHSAWAVNVAVRMAAGWNGPYVNTGDSGTDYTTDAWGNAYVWSPGASPATLVSRGADGAAGGTGYDQDLTISIASTDRQATVFGFISDGGAPYDSDAEIVLYYPDGTGAITSSTVTITAGDNGYFSYANIPYGIRSIIIYKPALATATDTIGPINVTVDTPNVQISSQVLDFNPLTSYRFSIDYVAKQ